MRDLMPIGQEWIVIATIVVLLFVSELGTKFLTLFRKKKEAKKALEA